MKKFIFATAAILAATTLSACQDDTPALPKPTGKTLVTVNGSAIKESQVEEQLVNIPASLLEGRKAEIEAQVLESLIERELIQQEAKKIDLNSNLDYAKQLHNMKIQLMTQFVLKHKVDEKVTEELLKEAYEKTKAARAFPAVKARHILVKTEKEAKAILRVVNPANFADMAKEKSTGPSNVNGGDLGWFRKEAMVPAFAEVAFKTNKGTIANKPVKTQFGWHVIFVEDKNDAYIPTFEEAKNPLRNELTQTVLRGYMKELRTNADIRFKNKPKEKTVVEQPNAEPATQ